MLKDEKPKRKNWLPRFWQREESLFMSEEEARQKELFELFLTTELGLEYLATMEPVIDDFIEKVKAAGISFNEIEIPNLS